MNLREAGLLSLLEEAKHQLQVHPAAQQVIVVKTAAGGVYHAAVPSVEDSAQEDALLALLREKGHTMVQAAVCLWQEGAAPDVPSFRFRQGLLGLCPENGDTALLLQGEKGLTVRLLRDTMPRA